MQKPLLAQGLIVFGLVIIVLAGFADTLGLGQQPGFGWKQALGMAIGVACVLGGVYWRRQLNSRPAAPSR